jgi:CheY-like chemotaxis protein
MKALLIVEDDAIADIIRFYLRPLGFDVLRYRNPLKALDNLEELEPDAILVSARDFPRHWKPLIQVARRSWAKERCVFILLKGDVFPFEEAAKAMYLGVNGVVKEDLSDRNELSRFQQILKRYVAIEDSRISDRHIPAEWDRLDFLFNRPDNGVPVAGRIETISVAGISFKPDIAALAEDLEPGSFLEDCSLRIGSDIVSIGCTLVRKNNVLAFAFTRMSDGDKDKLVAYLESASKREMDSLLKK